MPSLVWLSLAVVVTLVMAVVTIRSLRAAQEVAEVRQRGQATLARIGRELLSRFDQEALNEALDLLRLATRANATFVAENSGERGDGPVAVVTQVSADADPFPGEGSFRWKLPYLQHREKAAALARGEVVRLDEALSIVVGRAVDEVYALAVPLSVGGEWSGFLGIAFDRAAKDDPDPDLEMLETVAAMVGSFIEKRQTQEKLEQAIMFRDQFMASVSHEIRTPLTSVLGFTALLRGDGESLSPEESSEILSLIHHQAQEVADLVDDLLVAARAEVDALSVTREEVDLVTEIEGVLEGRLGTEAKDFVIAANRGHRVLADPIRVRQIIRNLVTNAVRYGGDQITVTTHRDGPEVGLVFSDNGPGVPPELGRKIFDPYQRGGSGLSRPESIGLGLAVSRQLARLMSGDLMLRSDLGPATFLLTLPAAPSKPATLSPSEVLTSRPA